MKPASTRRPLARTMLVIVLGLAATAFGVQVAFSKPPVAAPTLTVKPSAITSSTSATFAFTGPSGATFRCSLDGAGFTQCSSPTSYASLSDRQHTFQVKAVVGTDESTVTSYSWTVDTQAPPTPSLTSKPADPSNITSPSFGFSDTDTSATFSCSLDGAVFSACASPKSYAGLSQIAHTFQVRATDLAGNAGSPASYTWKVDTTAPAAPTFTSKPTNPTPNATNSFAWTGSEAGLSSECSLENGAWKTCISPYTWQINDGNYGQHQIAVRSVDAAGNASAATTYVFKYEKGLPDSGVPFKITGSVDGLTMGLWRPIVLTLSNPNPVPIYVSNVTVTVASDSTPSGCLRDQNVELEQSSISASQQVIVPANGSVILPAQGVTTPRIRLKNLPDVNQDVCKNKTFALTYSGTATN